MSKYKTTEKFNSYLNMDIDKKCCENPYIDFRNGNKVCLNCGMVHGLDYIGSESRTFNIEDIRKKKRTEPNWRKYGSRTVITAKNLDFNNNSSNNNKELFSRLSIIQKSLISSIERNFWEAKPKMKTLAFRMNLPNYIRELAWKIYSVAVKKKLTKGRSIDGFIAASLYAAIRIHGFPKLLEEVSEIIMIPRRTIIRSLGLLIKEVLPDLKLNYKPITAEQLIFKFGNELGIPL
ncbi:MAG: hypothetical protein ACTSQG_09735, partial [Promethearchaeota archaeon]